MNCDYKKISNYNLLSHRLSHWFLNIRRVINKVITLKTKNIHKYFEVQTIIKIRLFVSFTYIT